MGKVSSDKLSFFKFLEFLKIIRVCHKISFKMATVSFSKLLESLIKFVTFSRSHSPSPYPPPPQVSR